MSGDERGAPPPVSSGQRPCMKRRFDGYVCTRPEDHEGEHVAHDNIDNCVARWPR